MHNSVLSKRNHASHTRMLITAQLLAEHLKIDPAKVAALTPKHKDKDVRLMHQRNAVADLLDDIAISLGIDIPVPGQIELAKEAPVEDASGEPAGNQEPDGDQAGEPASNAELPPPVVDEE